MTGIGAIQARMAELQTRLAAMNPVVATDGAAFDATLDQALATQTAAGLTGAVGSTTGLTTLAGQQGRGLGALAGLTGLTGDGAVSGATGADGRSTDGRTTGADLVQAAKKYLGVPYVWGGESLSEGGLDCSGLVQLAFSDLGVDVPRVARQQMTIGTEVPSLDQARPGDLIVQRGGAHIGIYVGNGQMIHAPYPGQQVRISDIATTPTTIRRVLPADAPAGAGPAVDPARLALELAAGAGR